MQRIRRLPHFDQEGARKIILAKISSEFVFYCKKSQFWWAVISWVKSLCSIIQGWRWEGVGEDRVSRNSVKKGHMIKYWLDDIIFIDTATDIIQLDNTDITYRDINMQVRKGISITISLILIKFRRVLQGWHIFNFIFIKGLAWSLRALIKSSLNLFPYFATAKIST